MSLLVRAYKNFLFYFFLHFSFVWQLVILVFTFIFTFFLFYLKHVFLLFYLLEAVHEKKLRLAKCSIRRCHKHLK